MVPAWEYRVEERRTTADVAWLNALGQEGWEAVQSLPLHDAMGNSLPQVGHIWLFKRMVIDHPMIVQTQEVSGADDVGLVTADVEDQRTLQSLAASHERRMEAMQEQPKRRHQMSEENRQKARERMQAMVAARKVNRHAVQEPETQETDREPALP